MIRPSRPLSSARLLASGRLGALLFATALSPLALPFVPDHGQIGIVAAQAQQKVSISKIEMPTKHGRLVLNGVSVAGTKLSQADIEGLFKQTALAPVADVLQRFDADSMTVQSIEFHLKTEKQESVTVYEMFETGRIKAGAVEKASLKGGKQTDLMKSGDGKDLKLQTTFGRYAVENFDLTAMVRWLLDSDPTGKAPMKVLHGKYELASIDMDVNGVKVAIGRMQGAGFQARTARKAPVNLIAMIEASSAKPGDSKAALPLLTAMLDMYSGMTMGEGSIDGFTISGKDPKTGGDIKGSGGKITFVGGANPSFAFNDFSLAAADGFMKFKKIGFEGDFYTLAMLGLGQALQSELAAKPGEKNDPQLDEFRAVVAEASKTLGNRDVRFVFDGLDADLPPGTSAQSKERVKVSLGSFDVRMGGFVGMVPTKIDYALNGFKMPVPADSKDQGIKTLRELGIDVLDLSARIKGTWEEGKTRFLVDDVNFDMAKLAKAGIKAEIGNIPKPLFESPMTAWTYTLLGANAQSLSFSIENRGGIDNFIAKVAKDQRKSADQFKMELSAIAPAMIGMYLSGHPDGPALADGLTKFIRNPGSLNITLRAKSPGGITAMELMQAGENPGALLQKVKIETQVK